MKKSTDAIWEVFSVPKAVFYLKDKACTCRKWQLTRIPCVHAAAVIMPKLNGKYELVDVHFHAATYKAAYAYAIVPFTKADDDSD